jgi:hypothetical protein
MRLMRSDSPDAGRVLDFWQYEWLIYCPPDHTEENPGRKIIYLRARAIHQGTRASDIFGRLFSEVA